MTSLILKDATYVARTTLFQDLTLSFGAGDRVGLVAQNGAGKTTLLRCLAGELELTAGEITRSRGLTIGIMAQQVDPALEGLTFRDAVLDALDDEVRQGESWRADVVLDTMGAPPDLLSRRVAALSGGWQRLMLLMRVWVRDPDVLLMDEPTNHLDLEKILMLERWLDTWAGEVPVIVASHDRSFLDAVTNRTLFLRPETSRFYPLPYTRAREELERADAADAAEQARELKKAQKLRQQSAKLKNIGINSGSDLLLKKQKQLRERAERIEDQAASLHWERSGEIRLENQGTHAKVLIRIEMLPVATPDGRKLFEVAKLDIVQGDRIVLLGRNGTGKSTLMRLLRRALKQDADVPGIRATPSLVAGGMDQDLSAVPPRRTPFDLVAGRGESDQRMRSALATAGIAHDKQGRPIAELSFGQRSRLALLSLRLLAPNFYLLDEPTNHLDIAGQDALVEEIRRQNASCLLVSHDRTFVRAVGTRFLVVENGRLSESDTAEDFFASLAADGG
jgi:ATPase subunit of ABC transporter with duplicated ATPase domains